MSPFPVGEEFGGGAVPPPRILFKFLLKISGKLKVFRT